MKLNLQEILNVSEGLKQVAGKELPSKLSYSLSRLQMKIAEPLQVLDKTRNELVKKYGELQENESTKAKEMKVKTENLDKFYSELNEVLKTEENIEFNPIALSLFDGQSFSKEFFIVMDKLITE